MNDDNISIKRRIAAHQMQRNVRKSKILISRMRVLLKIIIICFLGYSLYRLYHCKMWYIPLDNIVKTNTKTVKIIGNTITPSYKILAQVKKTGIEPVPIFLMDTKIIEKEIEKLGPVNKAYVRRFWWPGRLIIYIDERIPILTISPAIDVAPIAFFAQGSKLIGREYLPLNPQYKTYLLITYGTKGDDYKNWDTKKVSLIEQVARTIEAVSKEKIEYIDFRDPNDIYVKLKTTSLRIGLMDSSVLQRVQSIDSILEQVRKMDKPTKYIDLRWEQSPYIKLGREYRKSNFPKILRSKEKQEFKSVKDDNNVTQNLQQEDIGEETENNENSNSSN